METIDGSSSTLKLSPNQLNHIFFNQKWSFQFNQFPFLFLSVFFHKENRCLSSSSKWEPYHLLFRLKVPIFRHCMFLNSDEPQWPNGHHSCLPCRTPGFDAWEGRDIRQWLSKSNQNLTTPRCKISTSKYGEDRLERASPAGMEVIKVMVHTKVK